MVSPKETVLVSRWKFLSRPSLVHQWSKEHEPFRLRFMYWLAQKYVSLCDSHSDFSFFHIFISFFQLQQKRPWGGKIRATCLSSSSWGSPSGQSSGAYSLPCSWACTWPRCWATCSSSCSSGWTLASTPPCTSSSATWPSLTSLFHQSQLQRCS